MSAANIPTSSNAPTSGTPEATPVERRCENADCNASKLLSMVPKRKTQQFVTEPNVMEKPMLINGFTTVFQVDGASAKLSDLKNVPNSSITQPKTIYRIVPNTHAHIVNYVVVDAEGESLRKINESDPATMRKLLESQKVSADQMLKKLIAGVTVAGGSNSSNNNNGVSGGVNTRNINNNATQSLPTIANTQTTQKLPTQPTGKLPTLAAAAAQSSAISTAQIQLPLRMHPNLKITAVASADTVTTMNAPSPVPSAPPSVPLITPVPLSALQSAPVMAAQRTNVLPVLPVAAPAATTQMPHMDTVEKPVFDKMQAELQELRRTVALLAEAQAKNNQLSQSPSSIVVKPNTTVASALRNVKRLRQS